VRAFGISGQRAGLDYRVSLPVPDPAARFFDELSLRGQEPLLAKARGTVRFDVVDGKRTEHWLIKLDRGHVSVSRDAVAADCIVRTDKALFAELATGTANPVAAYLRGALTFEGDPELLVLIQRVLPGPPRDRR
jgi:putative sterol carrier protein